MTPSSGASGPLPRKKYLLASSPVKNHKNRVMKTMRDNAVPCGINYKLEAEADEWLRKSREGVTRLEDKKDFLTGEQLALRYSREVYNSNGFPDPHVVSGLYRRAYNPLANSRPGKNKNSED